MWSGAGNLGSNDEVVLVNHDGFLDVLGRSGSKVTSQYGSTATAAWVTSMGIAATLKHADGAFVRYGPSNAGVDNNVLLWEGGTNASGMGFGYGPGFATYHANVLTTQGLT